MSRTTVNAVQKILLKDWNGADLLDPFIEAATAVVDRVDVCAAARSRTLTSTELELVERWLAAHFYAMSNQQLSSKSTKGAGGSFRASGGLNLDGTTYGQTARTLDYSGCLDAIAKRKVAAAVWLGRPPSEQTDYVDRD